MPSHDFECRICHAREVIQAPVGTAPAHPVCPHHLTPMSKNYAFSSTPVEIDVMSPSTGYFSSTRKYEDSLKKLSEATVERTGFDTQIIRAEPGDSQSAPPPTE